MEKVKPKSKKYTLRFAKPNKQIWQFIKEGKKTVETRAATVKYLPIRAKDILVLSCDGKKFEKEIKKVTHFKTVKAMLKKYHPQAINPLLSTYEETLKTYQSFPGYEEKIKQFGILAFEL